MKGMSVFARSADMAADALAESSKSASFLQPGRDAEKRRSALTENSKYSRGMQ